MESHESAAMPGTKLMDKEKGTFQLFKHPDKGSYGNSILLMISTMVLYLIFPYVLAGQYLRELLTFGMLLKVALFSGVFMLLVSALSFAIKSVSGKPVFKNELLVGALCGIGLILLLVFLVIGRIFVGDLDIFDLMSPSGLLSKLRFMLVFGLYILLFMINIFQQSLKASGTLDAVSWYVSPMAILLAFYIWGKIAAEFLMPNITPF